MKSIRYTCPYILVCLLFLFTGCRNFNKEAVRLVSHYVYAYSTGNKTLLKSTLSGRLLQNYLKLIVFFDSPDFERIKKELNNHRVVVTSIKKTAGNRYQVQYRLVLADKKTFADTLYIVEENGKLKIDDTGMFVYS